MANNRIRAKRFSLELLSASSPMCMMDYCMLPGLALQKSGV
jgi:hypothetical protein